MRKKFIIILVIIVIICTACERQANSDIIDKSLMYDIHGKNEFFYEVIDNKTVLCSRNILTKEKFRLFNQNNYHEASFALIGDKIYFLEANVLYSKYLSDLLSEPAIEGELFEEDYRSLYGNYDGHANIFTYNNDIYVQGSALYKLENGELKEMRQGVTSVFVYDDDMYLGDSDGSIYVLRTDMTHADQILSKEMLESIDDTYISILGGDCCVSGIHVTKDKIYFLLSVDNFNAGHIYVYNKETGDISRLNEIEGMSVNSFVVCNNDIYCYGMKYPHKNALYVISDNDMKILCPYIGGFTIIRGTIYYYDANAKSIKEV